MLESSPGNDMGFEKAPFKLSEEMINIMGGRPDAEPFKYFMEQTVKAFLAARYNITQILLEIYFYSRDLTLSIDNTLIRL